jgi:hypothetical protein
MFSKRSRSSNEKPLIVWARPEMKVTFRAEIMPGKSREERTFKIQEVLPNGRVKLYNFPDEHREGSFEPMDFKRNLAGRSQNS